MTCARTSLNRFAVWTERISQMLEYSAGIATPNLESGKLRICVKTAERRSLHDSWDHFNDVSALLWPIMLI